VASQIEATFRALGSVLDEPALAEQLATASQSNDRSALRTLLLTLP
jgi:hypothetical protein